MYFPWRDHVSRQRRGGTYRGCAHRWDLARQLDGLGDGQQALLDGALEVDVLDLLAQVRLRADKPDQAVLDLQVDVGALLDSFVDLADGLDNELMTTGKRLSASRPQQAAASHLRFRWVGR